MSVAIVIPARYASTRYPGKPLVALTGATGEKKTLIQRSWEAACHVAGVSRVVVATDDEQIRAASEAFGAEVVMTSSACRNGTERCAEALAALGPVEMVVNLQGDAPLTPPWFVEDLIAGLRGTDADLATPVLRCDGATLNGFLDDRRAGRVGGTTAVFDSTRHALYFSKEVIPYLPKVPDASATETPVFHHVGVYAYRPDALRRYTGWPEGVLEKLEGLEQLRFLEQGRKVLCVEVDARGRQFWELNNPSDVPKIEAMMAEMGLP